jgi:hypothetical protein
VVDAAITITIILTEVTELAATGENGQFWIIKVLNVNKKSLKFRRQFCFYKYKL